MSLYLSFEKKRKMEMCRVFLLCDDHDRDFRVERKISLYEYFNKKIIPVEINIYFFHLRAEKYLCASSILRKIDNIVAIFFPTQYPN